MKNGSMKIFCFKSKTIPPMMANTITEKASVNSVAESIVREMISVM